MASSPWKHPSPDELLSRLTGIEAALGRDRSVRWGPRTIDLDLLLYDDVVLSTPRLTLPHLCMAFRRFVIEPAAEVAPRVRDPLIGWTMCELADHLRTAKPYVAIASLDAAASATLASHLATSCGARTIIDPAAAALHGAAPSNLSGRDFAAEIELLAVRRELLLPRNWIEPARLAVSQFWLEQSRAQVVSLAIEHQRADLIAAVDRATADVVRPKLLVLLFEPPDESSTPAQNHNVSGPSAAEDHFLALAAAARRPGVGPLLELSSPDPRANQAEVAAAIAAMS